MSCESPFDAELNLAGWARKLTGVTVFTVGSVGLTGEVYESFAGKRAQTASLDGLLAWLERGDFELVAVGCPLLQYATWLDRMRQNRLDTIADFTPAAFATLS
jgi:2,4-dienoyl-CoA reductase-like NADH-dependent reductase (Old Yellow Enzyme family)